ncbi:ABC transporter permease [Chloroflexota bacterium]
MRVYVMRRVLLIIPTVFLLSLIVFFMVRFIPGSVVNMMLRGFDVVTEEDYAAVEHALGLDVPIPTQYGRWIGILPGTDGSFSGLFQGNLGDSLWTKTAVSDEIIGRWPITVELGLLGLIIGQLIALPTGVYSALRQNTWGDYVARSFAIICLAVPTMWLGTMIIVFPSIWWGYMPPIMYIPFTEDPIGNLKMVIVPAAILGMAMTGMTMRMTRTMMLEVLRQDYIRTAWAKGLKERVVVIRHALKNALIPVVTIVGMYVPTLIGGTVILEEIFCLPGMGRLLVNATADRDYPMISAIVLVMGIAIVFVNLAVDLTYAYLDPRLHYR